MKFPCKKALRLLQAKFESYSLRFILFVTYKWDLTSSSITWHWELESLACWAQSSVTKNVKCCEYERGERSTLQNPIGCVINGCVIVADEWLNLLPDQKVHCPACSLLCCKGRQASSLRPWPRRRSSFRASLRAKTPRTPSTGKKSNDWTDLLTKRVGTRGVEVSCSPRKSTFLLNQ